MPFIMERELKLGLTHPDDLHRLLNALPEPRAIIEQSNHYFIDMAGRLAESRTMVRVRVSTQRPAQGGTLIVLTRKRRLEARSGYFVAEEVECPIGLDDWAKIQAGELDLLDLGSEPLMDLALSPPLICHGVMHNRRHVIESGGYTLEVDRTSFPGDKVEVEVEVETEDPEGARAHLHAIAQGAEVSLFNQTRGKYARFIASLGA